MPEHATHLESLSTDSFPAHIRTCRDALARLPVDGPTKPMRAPIVALAREASRAGISSERLIIEVKALLFHLPQFEVRRALERGEMLHHLIGSAINAYYARPDD